MAFKLNQRKEFDRDSITGIIVGGYKAIELKAERDEAKVLSFKRTFGTAFLIIFGCIACYVGVHYIPAFIKLPTIITASDFNARAKHLKSQNSGYLLSPPIDAFNMKRAYIRQGQTVEAQYFVPQGKTLSLNIQQCQSRPIIEVFSCHIIKNRDIKIENSRSGLRSFTFPEDGFYKFSERLNGPAPMANDGQKRYVIWSRRLVSK